MIYLTCSKCGSKKIQPGRELDFRCVDCLTEMPMYAVKFTVGPDFDDRLVQASLNLNGAETVRALGNGKTL